MPCALADQFALARFGTFLTARWLAAAPLGSGRPAPEICSAVEGVVSALPSLLDCWKQGLKIEAGHMHSPELIAAHDSYMSLRSARMS